MTNRPRRLGQALVLALATAVLATASAASVAAAASPLPCKVHDLTKGIDRNSLQRAVWAADPGDVLLVQGTCVGTTVIRKDLTIGPMGTKHLPLPLGEEYVIDPRATLGSGSWRPTLIIDPAVDDLWITPGLRVKQGFVIGEPRDWRIGSKAAAPWYWAHWGGARPVLGGSRRRTLDTCAVWDAGRSGMRSSLAAAVDAAPRGARLVLAGRCQGPTTISANVFVHGSRLPGNHGCYHDPRSDATVCIDYVDHGPPRVKGQLDISADVDRLAFKRLTLQGGIRIE